MWVQIIVVLTSHSDLLSLQREREQPLIWLDPMLVAVSGIEDAYYTIPQGPRHLLAMYLTSEMFSKSESWLHSVAPKARALVNITLSAIGIFSS
jgi:hypothetical protein